MKGSRGRRVLIFIEDGSFLLDNRVQREVKTLTNAGIHVSVICPRYPGEKFHDTPDGVPVYRYRKWVPSDGFIGHVFEYASSLLKGGLLSWWVFFRHGFSVFHACNPPDLLFLIGILFKPFRTAFLFDHHDLCPELYLSRFGGRSGAVYRILCWLERMTMKTADVVVATNRSYKRIAVERCAVPENRVFVVRNGPDLDKFKPDAGSSAGKTTDEILVGYLGNMNPQDGVDHLLAAARHIKHVRGRQDVSFLLIGGGDAQPELVRLSQKWDVSDICRFTGRLPDTEMLASLNRCDICVQPDPSNPLNDVSTMNKIMEYMALQKPVVAFDLPETRFSGSDAALYAEPNRVDDLADKILFLADHPEVRAELGERGRRRVEEVLCWEHSEEQLLEAYGVAFRDRGMLR